MSTLSKETIQQIGQTLERNSRVTMAFLFGSYAKDAARPDSDVDIAVYLQEPILPK